LEEENRKEGEEAQKKLGGGRNRGKKVGGREKKKSWEKGELNRMRKSKSREEGEIGSESREKDDLLPCSSPLLTLC